MDAYSRFLNMKNITSAISAGALLLLAITQVPTALKARAELSCFKDAMSYSGKRPPKLQRLWAVSYCNEGR